MELIKQLEALRIPDSDFFNTPIEQRRIYAGKNEMLDDCLEIIWQWLYQEEYVH